MIYRPQFAYPTPRGYRDEQFHYAFDLSNVPQLAKTSIAAGAFLQNIPLPLQQDAAFLWNSITVSGANSADPVIAGRFRDPYGNYLSDDFVPFDLYCHPAGGPVIGTLDCPWEPAIECPAGAIIWLDLKNQTTGSSNLTLVRLLLGGLKRYPIGRVA